MQPHTQHWAEPHRGRHVASHDSESEADYEAHEPRGRLPKGDGRRRGTKRTRRPSTKPPSILQLAYRLAPNNKAREEVERAVGNRLHRSRGRPMVRNIDVWRHFQHKQELQEFQRALNERDRQVGQGAARALESGRQGFYFD